MVVCLLMTFTNCQFKIFQDDCICFMWVTYPLLKENKNGKWGDSWIKTNKKSGLKFRILDKSK